MNFESFLEVAIIKNSTICSIPVEDPSRYGVLELEGTKIINFIEKPKDMKYGNNISLGVYCFHKKDIKEIKNNLEVPCSFEKDVFPELAKNNLLDCFSVNGKYVRCRNKRVVYICSYRKLKIIGFLNQRPSEKTQ